MKVKLKNIAGTIESFLQNAATSVWTWTLPNKSGTVAMLDDVNAIIEDELNPGETAKGPSQDVVLGALSTLQSSSEAYADAGDSAAQEYAEGLVSNVPAKRVMDVKRDAALPAYDYTPASGSTRAILTFQANGFFPSTDGVINDSNPANTITSVLLTGESGPNIGLNGPWLVIGKGSLSIKAVLQRPIDCQGPLAGFALDLATVSIRRGTVYAGKTFKQTNIDVTVDTSAQNWVDTSSAAVVGLQDLFIPASAMWPRATGGCAALAATEISTSLINIQSLDFDQTTQEFAQFLLSLPRNWNNGTVTMKFYWTAAAGAGSVVWGVKAGAYGDGAVLTTALGAEQTIADALIATNDVHITAYTPNITLAGPATDAAFLAFQISRNPADGGDTLTADAKLLGVVITLTTDAAVAA